MARLMSGVLLVLHLLISQNEMMQVEGAVCSTKSKLFNGICSSDSNCATICEKEGFLYGHCKGILMRCLCYKDCKGAARPPHKPPPPPPTPRIPPPPPPPCGCHKPPLSPPPPIPGTPPPCGFPKPPATPPPPCDCHNPPPPPNPRPPKISPPCAPPLK